MAFKSTSDDIELDFATVEDIQEVVLEGMLPPGIDLYDGGVEPMRKHVATRGAKIGHAVKNRRRIQPR